MVGCQYLLGFCRFIAKKSLKSGTVLESMLESFVLLYLRGNAGPKRVAAIGIVITEVLS